MNSEGKFSYPENKLHYQGKCCKLKESKHEQKENSLAV